MTRGSGKGDGSATAARPTRCQLLWALLFLVLASALGWWLIVTLLG